MAYSDHEPTEYGQICSESLNLMMAKWACLLKILCATCYEKKRIGVRRVRRFLKFNSALGFRQG